MYVKLVLHRLTYHLSLDHSSFPARGVIFLTDRAEVAGHVIVREKVGQPVLKLVPGPSTTVRGGPGVCIPRDIWSTAVRDEVMVQDILGEML